MRKWNAEPDKQGCVLLPSAILWSSPNFEDCSTHTHFLSVLFGSKKLFQNVQTYNFDNHLLPCPIPTAEELENGAQREGLYVSALCQDSGRKTQKLRLESCRHICSVTLVLLRWGALVERWLEHNHMFFPCGPGFLWTQ